MKRSRIVIRLGMLVASLALMVAGTSFLSVHTHTRYAAVMDGRRGARVAACEPGIAAVVAGGTSSEQSAANSLPDGEAGTLWQQDDRACFGEVRDYFAIGAAMLLVGFGFFERRRRLPGRLPDIRFGNSRRATTTRRRLLQTRR